MLLLLPFLVAPAFFDEAPEPLEEACPHGNDDNDDLDGVNLGKDHCHAGSLALFQRARHHDSRMTAKAGQVNVQGLVERDFFMGDRCMHKPA